MPNEEAKALGAWCERWLGARPRSPLFRSGHLSEVTGLALEDGRCVVDKVRPPSARIEACVRVQQALWRQRFPCPQPLAGPAPLGGRVATAETYVPGGEQRPAAPDAPRAFATLLAELVRLAPAPASLAALDPAPPWAGWDHAEPGVWPRSDEDGRDLNAGPRFDWLDKLGERVRRRLAASTLRAAVGHVDWESQNIRWHDGRPLAVDDWDSVAARPECAIAGLAAAVFTAEGAPLTSPMTVEGEAFAAYADDRGRAWSAEAAQLAWAAGLWVRAFNARKRVVAGPDEVYEASLARLAEEADERLRRAGA